MVLPYTKSSRASLALAAALTLLPAAPAATMTFQHSGNGSGTLNDKPFAATDFIITALGDTNNRQPISDGWYIDHSSVRIWINSVGTYDILSPTRTFVSHNGQMVGFSRAGSLGLDLFNGPHNAAFVTWEMLTPIGPYTGGGGLLQWLNSPQINTTGGILIFNDAATTATFQAFIPEPATFVLCGALGLLLRRR